MYSVTGATFLIMKGRTIMGFQAADKIEELTYDFKPHANVAGTIPEPSSVQVENYQHAMVDALKGSGLDPEKLQAGEFKLDDLDSLMTKSKELGDVMLNATADLTGIAHSTLRDLPYRIKTAFMGWVAGEFFRPEG